VGAEVTVPQAADGSQDPSRIRVRGDDVRIFASAPPLRLTGESADS
jgi:hypothetical protein